MRFRVRMYLHARARACALARARLRANVCARMRSFTRTHARTLTCAHVYHGQEFVANDSELPAQDDPGVSRERHKAPSKGRAENRSEEGRPLIARIGVKVMPAPMFARKPMERVPAFLALELIGGSDQGGGLHNAKEGTVKRRMCVKGGNWPLLQSLVEHPTHRDCGRVF